jgi:opacity protein-like surface antigen
MIRNLVVALICIIPGVASAADLFATFALGNDTKTASGNGQNIEVKPTNQFIVTPGFDFVNVGIAAIGMEVPVAFGGPARAVFSNNRLASEKMDFLLAPSARLRAFSGFRLSPWASVGVGVGRFDRTSFSSPSNAWNTATESQFTIAVGVGADFRVAGPLALRAEGRNFNYKSVDGLKRNNFQFLVGAGLRF